MRNMRAFRIATAAATLFTVALSLQACGDPDHPRLTEAQRHGVGAACSADTDCFVGDEPLVCLPFKGGYCGLEGCQANDDCPAGSGCVAHDDGSNYCFLLCTDKPQCNYTRSVEDESNCVSNITFASDAKNSKACVPPS